MKSKGRRPARGRGSLTVAVTAAALVAAGLLLAPEGGRTQSSEPVSPQPMLGTADLETILMGAAGEGAPGETWAYRRLPLDVGPPVVDGRTVPFGPASDPSAPDPQLAFLRFTDATGWQVYQTPVDQNGEPYRGGIPNPASGRITPRAGGVLVVRDPRRPLDNQAVVLARNPGGAGRFRTLPDPPPSVLLPEDGGEPAETLAEERGVGRIAITAFESADRTAAFVAPIGRAREDAVLYFNGASWSREPVCLPPDDPPAPPPSGSACPAAPATQATFRIVALAATSQENAWLLGRTDEALGRGIVLFQRQVENGRARWVQRSLDAPLFEAAATPAQGIEGVRPLEGNAESLTVTDEAVWIDGALEAGGEPRDFTLHFDPGAGAGRVTQAWCDAANGSGAALCNQPLPLTFSKREGYRSFAWSAGGPFGTRVITNPLPVGGDEEGNRGTYATLEGERFRRRPGAGGNRRRSGAFRGPDDGWLEGPVRIAHGPRPSRLRKWPVSVRAPFTDVAAEPRRPPGALDAQALTVGSDGGVARFSPAGGWNREFLLSSSGSVARSNLRGVAWPEPERAHAVGDLGAMWLWRAETGLWERDPGAPLGFEGDLMDVAFAPDDPFRGYAVGKSGLILRYDKSWEPESPPAGFEGANLTSISFAGSQALVVAGSDVLVNDGSGWRVDEGVRELLATVHAGAPQLFTVSGLPDGGAVVAGRDIVLERDGAGGRWRFSDQPLIGSTVVAAGAFREGARVRAMVSVVPRVPYPVPDEIPPVDPNVPPPLIPPFPLPGDGYVLRETATGWRDEQRTAFSGSGFDRPVKSDPILGFDLDANGEGWAVGGWSGEADSAGRGSSSRSASGRADRARVQTAGIYRYAASTEPAGPPAAGVAGVRLENQVARLAVAGHAQCEQPCADLAEQGIAPDRTLAATLDTVAALAAQRNGPRMLLYTGGRTNHAIGRQPPAEAARFAQLLGRQPGLPVYPAVSAGDSAGGGPTAFREAFAGFGAPFGAGPAPGSVSAGGIPGAAPGPGARTHYAFNSAAPGGTVRVIVIDNSAGSLAASDPFQNPAEPQRPWLEAVLADARAKGIPAVVMGSRDLNTRFLPSLNTASDGAEVARLLVDGGASAYFFERPEENRSYRIPSGAATTIPAYGTGTLGYRSPIANVTTTGGADSLFGDTSFLIAEVDLARRDPSTNRAPVAVRTIPIIDDLSLQPVDGTLIRRSRVALFQGLGRRPIAGDRWGRPSGDGSPSPPGGDPYVSFPPALCIAPTCGTRLTPEYEFTSSDPDIGDFVRVDPQSNNLRKPFIGPGDKVATDKSSGLFCAFNAGKTTVTVRAGGLQYSQVVTVLGGSVQRPCGTRPLDPGRFARPASVAPPPPPPPPVSPTPTGSPPPTIAPPPPPASTPTATPAPPAAATPAPTPPAPPAPVPPPILPALPPVPLAPPDLPGIPPGVPPPAPPANIRPIPPGGAVARVLQVEEKREEEVAPETESAASSYMPEEHRSPAPYVLGFAVLAAFAGATIVRGLPRGGDRRRREAALVTVSLDRRPPPSRGGPTGRRPPSIDPPPYRVPPRRH